MDATEVVIFRKQFNLCVYTTVNDTQLNQQILKWLILLACLLVVVRRFRRRRCTDVVVCGTVISGHEGDCGDRSPKHRFCRSEDRQVQLE